MNEGMNFQHEEPRQGAALRAYMPGASQMTSPVFEGGFEDTFSPDCSDVGRN